MSLDTPTGPRIDADDLLDMRKAHEQFMQRYKSRGGKVASWTCPHCHLPNDGMQPTREQVGDRGCWGSATTCLSCGMVDLVRIWPDGRTEAFKLGQ